jgi:hypothetical protein
MDASRFKTISRLLIGTASRRSLLGFALGGLTERMGLVAAESKTSKQAREKPCGPCKRRQNGKCKPKPNGTPCGNGGNCRGGKCQEPPDPGCVETCEGCCSHGRCYPGTQVERCGSGGITCARCPSGEICTVDRLCALPTCGNGGPCRVFVTSLPVTGNLGGLDTADAVCQDVADEAELPGAYRAWLSDDSESPSTRFMRSPGPYLLVDDTVIANDWTALTSGTLQAPIDRDETGHDFLPPFAAWTNTKADGTLDESLADCESWRTTVAFGGYGDFTSTNASWTDSDRYEPCSAGLHLYCFQQG